MKNLIKIVSINIAVLFVLLIVLEFILRLAGMDTIFKMERKAPGWKNRYQDACQQISTQKLIVYDKFYTDNEGIFKANPEYFAKTKNGNKVETIINKDGFRGNQFEYVKTPRPKILLIGDSFTWGATAKPLTNSFADLLEAAGYYVYNAGIPGTDPQQYAMIAEKYAAKLKPDVVAVCVYMGNDVSTRPLLIKPNKNIHYVTNFGFLMGHDDYGNFFQDAGEAFQYLKNRKCGYFTDPWNYFLYKTVIGKGIYKAITRENRGPKYDGTKKWVKDSLQQIQDSCDKNSIKCIVFLIPVVNQDVNKAKSIQSNLYLFSGVSYYYPANMERRDYCEPPNKHFNNNGHRKYANFMISVLKQNGFGKK